MKKDEVPAFKKFVAHKDGATNKELKKKQYAKKTEVPIRTYSRYI